MFRRAALAVLALPLMAGLAFADARCEVPLGAWQPREALQKKLEAEGWTGLKIRTDDGCYKAMGRDGHGTVVKGLFDPATLERVETDGHHDDHGRREREDD